MEQRGTDDASLVDSLVRGHAEAARELYVRHCRTILRFALAMTDSLATAEDIVHDTFIELLRLPRNYDPARGSLHAYLCGIARHQIARRVRSAARTLRAPDDFDGQVRAPESDPAERAAMAPASTLEDEAERSQDIERVRAAVGALPLLYREVIVWCDLEELPYATVAGILRCPVGTVKSRLYRGRALLTETLRYFRYSGGCPSEPDRGGVADCIAHSGPPFAAALRGGST